MMRVGLSESAYRRRLQTTYKLLRLSALVVSVIGKGTHKVSGMCWEDERK